MSLTKDGSSSVWDVLASFGAVCGSWDASAFFIKVGAQPTSSGQFVTKFAKFIASFISFHYNNTLCLVSKVVYLLSTVYYN